MEPLSHPPLYQLPIPPSRSAIADQSDETDREEDRLSEDNSEVSVLSSQLAGIVDEAFYGRNLAPSLTSQRSSRLTFTVEEDIPFVDRNKPQFGQQTAMENQFVESEERRVGNLSLACDWLPYTLRPGYLLFLLIVSLGSSVAILLLTWLSTVNKGLATNNNSIALLFGWRFAPTLIAIIYSLL